MSRGDKIVRIQDGAYGYFDSVLPSGRLKYYWYDTKGRTWPGPSADERQWGDVDPDEVMTLAD